MGDVMFKVVKQPLKNYESRVRARSLLNPSFSAACTFFFLLFIYLFIVSFLFLFRERNIVLSRVYLGITKWRDNTAYFSFYTIYTI